MNVDDSPPLNTLNIYKAYLTDNESLEYANYNGTDIFKIFLYPESPGEAFTRNKPLKLKQELDTYFEASKIENVRFTRNGNLLIQTKDYETAKIALNLNSVTGIKAKSRFNIEHISTRFLMYNVDKNTNLEEVAEGLETENNIKVCEILRFNKKDKSPSNTVLVTIFGFNLPNQIKLWYQIHNIDLFIDKPRACYKCFAYNHPPKTCTNKQTCVKCSNELSDSHKKDTCINEKKCANCQGAHDSLDKTCIFYLKELEINRLKAEKHLTLSEARNLHKSKENQKTMAKRITNTANSNYVTKSDLNTAIQELAKVFQNSLAEAINKTIVQQENRIQTLIVESLNNYAIQQENNFNKMVTKTFREMKNAIVETISNTNVKSTMTCLKPNLKKNNKKGGTNIKLSKAVNADFLQSSLNDFSQKPETSLTMYDVIKNKERTNK